MANEKEGMTIILFSGDLDKSIAAFILANGAAAYEQDVTIFFTFWGLNVLRKDAYVPTQKTFLEKLFGKMMPRGSNKLGLSKMNFAGIGPKLIKHIMKKHNALSLPELIELAKEQNVKLVACTMTMDLLGLKQEELIDGIEYGGVATYIGDASERNISLFI